MPEPTKTPSTPSCIIKRASAGVAMPPAAKLTTGRRARPGDLDDQIVGRAQVLGLGHQLFFAQRGQLADLVQHRARVADSLDDVAGAGLALGADHGRAFADAAQRLAQVAAAADKRHLEVVLVDVVRLVGRRQHFALVDVVDADRLQHLRLDKVADAALGHHRDGHGLHDALDQLGIAHAGHAALSANIARAHAPAPSRRRRRRPRRSWHAPA